MPADMNKWFLQIGRNAGVQTIMGGSIGLCWGGTYHQGDAFLERGDKGDKGGQGIEGGSPPVTPVGKTLPYHGVCFRLQIKPEKIPFWIKLRNPISWIQDLDVS